MAGLRTDTNYIMRLTIKNTIVITYGALVVFTATDDEIDLPAGDDSLLVAGVALEAGTGDATGSVKIDVALRGPSLPCVSAGAIAAGKTVGAKGTAGKVLASVTAGALFGRAISNTSGDAQRVWVCA